MKKKVLIVMPCDLPVPSVKGGAVSTLVESLMHQNELFKCLDLWVFTNCCSMSLAAEKKYFQTNFVHFGAHPILAIIDRLFFRKKLYLKKMSIIRQVQCVLRKQNFDAVVLQNSGFLLNVLSDKKIADRYEGRVFYHLHNDVPNSAAVNYLYRSQLFLISNYLKKKLVKRCGTAIEQNCLILKNGIDVERFLRSQTIIEKDSLRKKYGINGKKVLLFVGRIDPTKGIAELLEAVEKLNDDYTLLMVGSTNFGGGDKSSFERVIEAKCLKMGRKVVFTGFVHNKELWKLYKIADVAVLPSTWEEPAGLTMLEASVSGIPLITTRVGGIPEYINEKSALFIENNSCLVKNLYNAILRVFENLEQWSELAKKNQRYYSDNYNERKYYHDFIGFLK